MARHESDREDLLRDATAYRDRIELQSPGELEPIFAGFRPDGALSLYFGTDPAYHFDSQGRLRRAFLQGELYRSQGPTLARLVRERTASATVLNRHDLSADELQSILTGLRERLTLLRQALEAGTCRVLRSVPDGSDHRTRLLATLELAAEGNLSPAVRGRP